MEISFKMPVNATPQTIWPYFVLESQRALWESDLEYMRLDGDIQSGTTGQMKLKNMPAMDFTLVDIIPLQQFCEKFVLPDLGTLYFNHEIIQSEGKVFIRQSIRLESQTVEKAGIELLRKIFDDVPDTMLSIKQLVEK